MSSGKFAKSQSKIQASELKKHAKLLTNEKFADVIFNVIDLKQKIQMVGHSVVIERRCPALINKDSKKKEKKKKGATITIDVPPEGNLNKKTLPELLQYIYAGSVNFLALNIPSVLQLSLVAQSLEQPRLNWMCENYLRSILALENIFSVLKFSHLMNQKAVKGYALQFVLKHYSEVISNKEGVKDLGIELFQEAVTIYTQSLTGDVQFPNFPPEPEDTLVEDWRAIYESTPQTCDVYFKVGEAIIPANRGVLSAQSPELAALCSITPTPYKSKDKSAPSEMTEFVVVPVLRPKDENQHNLVTVQATEEGFKAMLRFVYYGEYAIDPVPACELLPFCKDWGLGDLMGICEDIISKNISQKTVVQFLATTYLPQIEDRDSLVVAFRRECIKYLVTNLSSVDLAPLSHMFPIIAFDILVESQRQHTKGGLRASQPSTPPLMHPHMGLTAPVEIKEDHSALHTPPTSTSTGNLNNNNNNNYNNNNNNNNGTPKVESANGHAPVSTSAGAPPTLSTPPPLKVEGSRSGTTLLMTPPPPTLLTPPTVLAPPPPLTVPLPKAPSLNSSPSSPPQSPTTGTKSGGSGSREGSMMLSSSKGATNVTINSSTPPNNAAGPAVSMTSSNSNKGVTASPSASGSDKDNKKDKKEKKEKKEKVPKEKKEKK